MTRFILGALCLVQALTTTAATFTSDTYIGPTDYSIEGEDIVVTNCTLTVDGAHGFNSLQLQNGGVLTHSAFANGPGQITNYVVDENQTLSDSNFATLLNTNVDMNTIVVMDSSGTITYTPNVDYLITDSNQFTELTLTTNSAIAEGTNVLVDYTWYQNYQGFSLTISNDMEVLAGAAVNIRGKGYAGGYGPGAGISGVTNYPFSYIAGGGGGHAGCGGLSSLSGFGGGSYDSTTNPASLGSGGGTGSTNGGAGGGVAQIFVGGTLEVDGPILADGFNGTNRHSGGGAGGGLLISAGTLAGAGSITANGGAADLPDGGGGGGGCVVIYFGTNNFTGSISTFGGVGSTYGGAGTIFTQSFTDPAGQLLIANAGVAGSNTTVSANAAISNLTISGGAIAQSIGFTATNIYIGSNCSLVPLAPGKLTVIANGNVTVDSNATINADFASLSGPGSGSFVCGAGTGGGYGGYGGAGGSCGRNGGTVYGSITQPFTVGSPGAGIGTYSAGGGAVQLTVAGTLSLSGKILADGASGAVGASAGGGSGGGVWLTVGTLAGNGLISANGGAADALGGGGGGGGGRIAIYFNTNQFAGSVAAHGGAGANAGGPGTVYSLTNGSTFGQLTVDNGGLTGFALLPSTPLADLTISGGSTVSNYDGNTAALRNLFIGSNSWFSTWSSTILRITSTNVTIQPAGGITMDGVSSSGPGAGGSFNNTGSGGGNAGNGGNSTSGAPGGTGNNFVISLANTTGGNGGAGNGGPGGGGGGVINLTVAGKLRVDGVISANGLASPALNGGGGAGGSISLNVGTLSGAGTISVNGGVGNNLVGGGGGGGFLDVTSGTNQFSGIMMARGGTGGNPGGAGFVYLLQNPYPFQQSTVTSDNGGLRAGLTPVNLNDLPPGLSLNITGGAVVANLNSGMNVGNLLIGSNSTFLAGGFTSQQTYSIGTNATIQAGGSLNADGINNNVSSPGQGQLYGGGGSYGGSGGAGFTNFGIGGPIFDSLTAPSSEGGHGASALGGAVGGNGGGSLRITVNGKLQLDGRISAQGLAPTNANAGGGAGGSIWLSAGTLAGAGVLSVNGGAGGNQTGGGGGGGRIALNYNSNSFTGNLTAYGGPGINYGGAGTVYVTSAFSGQGQSTQLTIDNGGAAGNTFLSSLPVNFNFTVTGADTVALTNSTTIPPIRNFFLGSNSAFICNPFSQQLVTVLTNATIQAGARFTSDGASTSTGGSSLNQTGGGGGHGGYGGASLSNALGGNVISDLVTQPTSPGNRGGAGFQNLAGGNGGGAFELAVNGTLRVDGKISADGVVSTGLNSGGGSGGSVWLSVGTLSGTGTISANGGAGNNVGGGGGGGRVAVSCRTNSYSGAFAARGGAGGHFGGAGTICLPVFGPPTLPPGQQVQVIIDNGGTRGTNTLLSGLPSSAIVTVNSGGSATLQGSTSVASLTISSNAVLTAIPGSDAVLSLSAANLTIQPGGAITLDGSGFPANGGSGHGFSASSGAGGGGHGGDGSSGLNAAGGGAYDTIIPPSQAGSGGGSFYSTSGSAGGGALNLNVYDGLLQVDGAITANGASATTNGAGGGSGGSLSIHAVNFIGAGRISADGGNGDLSSGGGGGGGRIAIYTSRIPTFTNTFFTGTLSAHGGLGVGPSGGAGTIFFTTNSLSGSQLIVDNGGLIGTNTPLASLSSAVNLVLRNGAEADSTVPLTLQSLSINSGAGFNADSLSPLNLTVLGDAYVDSNAFIIADDAGYNPGVGPYGAGGIDGFGDGGGGGYGGYGGNSLHLAVGGGTYGSPNQPVNLGSAGGVSPFLAGFSQGGGAIRLLVDGTLALNGTISANGNDGVIEGAGGGSGGSIWITTSSLSGAGNIIANGGTGQDGQGGGGGGGRIAIYASANSFAGSASANGGNGFESGQPGTIFIATNLLVSGSVTDTNGAGVSGVTLQPDGLTSVTTDNNGAYSVATPLFWTGSITPTSAGLYLPNVRNYSGISSNVPNQNFIMVLPSDFNFSGSEFDGTNAGFSWYGINGVSYQPLVSSDLLNWAPYGSPIIGTNGPAMFLVPATNAPQQFFRLSVNYY